MANRLPTDLLKDLRPMQLPYIPGSALARIVEEVGPGVTAFQRGQAVFGQSAKGTYTEYTTASVATLALKPETLSFDEAATLAGARRLPGRASLSMAHCKPIKLS